MWGFRKTASVRNPPADQRSRISRQTSVFRSPFKSQGSVLPEWCRWMHGRGQGCLRGQTCLRRIMMFETDPAMSRSAIRRKTIAARISRWSSCLTSRWTHPQLSGSGFLGGPTFRQPAFEMCSFSCASFRFEGPPAPPHRVQHYSQLSGNCDVCSLEPDAVAQLETPATKGAILAGPRQDVGSGLIEIGSQQFVPLTGYPTLLIDRPGLVASWCEPNPGRGGPP